MAQWNVVIVGFRLNAAERPAHVLERVLGLSPEQAKEKTRSFPHVALEAVTKERADGAAALLREAGARVEIRPFEATAPASRRSIVLTPAGRKSLVLADAPSVSRSLAARLPAGGGLPPSASVAKPLTAESETRLSVYRLGELEIAIEAPVRSIAKPAAAQPVQEAARLRAVPEQAPKASTPAPAFMEPITAMRPIGSAERAAQKPLPAMTAPDTTKAEAPTQALGARMTWSPGDLHTIDDTLNSYTDGAPLEIDETALPHQPPKKVYRARGRASIVDRARAYEATHRGTLLASIIRQLREGMVAISALILLSVCAAAAISILREGRAMRARAQDANDNVTESSLHAASGSDQAAPIGDRGASARTAEIATRLPNARPSFAEMRTRGLHRVAVEWPVGNDLPPERATCILLADPKPEDVERVRGDRVALEIPASVASQLNDHMETLKLAEGRDSIHFERLCLAEAE